jgi:hypothetical protein
MKKTLITSLTSATLFALPLVVSAQGQLTNIQQLIVSIKGIVNMLIPIAVAVTVVVFFWGLIKYVGGGGKSHEQGRNIMIAGIIALFIEVTLWGVVGFVQNAIGINSSQGNIQIPQIQ